MRSMRLPFTGWLAVVSLLIAWPLHVRAASYTFTKIADTSGPFSQFDFPGAPSINARGVVAFHAGKAGIPGMGDGIFTSTGGSIATIVDTSGPFTGFNDRLSINDAGTIAFLASVKVGSPGIFTSHAGSITTIVDTSGPLTAVGIPAINNAGTVAFFGCLDTLNPSCPLDRTAAQGIFTGDGGPLTTIVDTSGPSGPFSNFGNPSINNAGMVVFLAFLKAGGSGIFTGPDPVADKVITTGDLLFGFTVTSLGFLQGLGLNDAGQVAFFATLANGASGVFRADPVP